MEKYDVAIIGGGSAGLAALKQLSTLGKQAVLLEAGEKVGVKNISGGILYSKNQTKVGSTMWKMFTGKALSVRHHYREKLQSIFSTQLQKIKFFPWI